MPPETTQGAGTAQTSQGSGEPPIAPAGQPGQPQSGQEFDRKAIESRAHAHGRTAALKELATSHGFTSVEEMGAFVASHRQADDAAAAQATAEREEKTQLATKLAAAERKIAGLQATEKQLGELREAIKGDRIRAAVLEAGCLPDAADLAVVAVADRVKWSEDFSALEVYSLADPAKKLESLAELVAELKGKRDFLFTGQGRSGSGFVRGPGGKPPAPPPAYTEPPSMTELLGWNKK